MAEPLVPKYITDLSDVYIEAQIRLIKGIQQGKEKGNAIAYQEAQLKQVEAEIRRLNQLSVEWVRGTIPDEYKKSVKAAIKAIGEDGTAEAATRFSKMHTRAINNLVENTSDSLVSANNFVGRQITDIIRMETLKAVQQKLATGGTVKELKNDIMNRLISSNGTGVKTKNGRMINMQSYAEMVARTSTREATNRALLNQLTASGRDLAKMSHHASACSVCSPLEGRVYSISGTSKDFPPLGKAFSGIYANIHPNCRHVLVPYIRGLADDPEGDMAFSNRPFDIDTRTQDNIDKYNARQEEKSDRLRDRKQYERYRMVMPNDVPKSFSGFRAMKKANSDKFQELDSTYRSIRAKYGADTAAEIDKVVHPLPFVTLNRVAPTNTVKELVSEAPDAAFKKLAAKHSNVTDMWMDLTPKQQVEFSNYLKENGMKRAEYFDKYKKAEPVVTAPVKPVEKAKEVKQAKPKKPVAIVKDDTARGHLEQEAVIKTAGATYSDKMSNFIQKDLGVSKERAEAYQEAIGGFAGSEYREMRIASIKGVNVTDTHKRMAKNMDEFIENSPKFKGEVHRGMRVSQADIASFTEGATIDMKGMSSWTSDKKIATEFAKGDEGHAVIMHVTNKTGASITHLSSLPYQREVVSPSTTKYGVLRSEKKGNTVHVYLEER